MARKIAIFLIWSVFACSVFGEEPINIPDINLKAAIEAELHVSDPNVTDMLNLTSLYSYSIRNKIKDLTGLEYAKNLTTLDLRGNQISNISVLSELNNLSYLCLSVNQIDDISPLTGVMNLTVLYLESNRISDISPIGGLTNLQELYLSSNQISDLVTSIGLTNLKNFIFQQIK